jgi:CHAT domain-containing protein
MGLRAALLGAGARGVLVSLWPVDDNATRALMEHFYENLWNSKTLIPPAEALTKAQQAVRDEAGGKWKHPYYWAGWVYDGQGW